MGASSLSALLQATGNNKKRKTVQVKDAWLAFCQQGRCAGYNFQQIASAWKQSSVRLSLVEAMPESERSKKRMDVA